MLTGVPIAMQFSEIDKTGEWPSTWAHNALLKVHLHCGDMTGALVLVDAICPPECRWEPDSSTWSILLAGATKLRRPDVAALVRPRHTSVPPYGLSHLCCSERRAVRCGSRPTAMPRPHVEKHPRLLGPALHIMGLFFSVDHLRMSRHCRICKRPQLCSFCSSNPSKLLDLPVGT